MPILKQLTCAVEWAGSNLALKEYQTTYADGYVETYVAVPSTPTPFSVHLKSNGYIAPGLAIFVYMDGVYQCNRNRHNLKIPDGNTTRRQTEIDFRVRQKEEMLADGTFQGLQWKFEKVNIVSDTTVETQNQAPHEGEYVGTIEVVVLRCCPSNAVPKYKFRSSEPSENKRTSSPSATSQHLSDSDDMGDWFDGAGSPKPKNKFQSTTQLFSLDGSYDPDSPKNTAWDSWDNPAAPVEKPKEDPKNTAWDPWDNAPAAEAQDVEEAKSPVSDAWKIPSAAAREAKTTAWDANDKVPVAKAQSRTGAWGQPASAKEKPKVEPKTSDTLSSLKDKPKVEEKTGAWGKQSRTGSWGAWGKSLASEDKPTIGTMEMLNETEGIMHPSTSNNVAEKVKGSRRRDTSRDSLHSDWNVAGSERGRSRQPRSAINSPTSPTVKIRGGGPGSYRVGSPVDGRTSPGVVININNGPPPPRDWMTGAKAEREAAKAGKAGSYKVPTPPVDNDPWTMNIPAEDYSKEAETHAPGGNWDWAAGNNEATKEDNNSQMPGSWGDSGGETHGNDAWDNNNSQEKDKWDNDNNGNNDIKRDDAWETGNREDDKNDDNWGKDNQQIESWDNNDIVDDNIGTDKKADVDITWGSFETDKEKENQKPAFSFGNSKAKTKPPRGSKKEWKAALAAAAAAKIEAEPANSNNHIQPKSPPKDAKATVIPEKTALPGVWSPKLKPVPASILSKKGSPKGAGPAKAHSAAGLPMTSPPQPKPYWSTWKEGDKNEPIDSPIYSVPSEVANRNNTSHQVRPGKPAQYAHKTATPKYMDTQDNPYAVFVFHYRDKEIIEVMLKTTIEEPEENEKERLAALSKDELVEELMKMKEKEKEKEKLASQGNGSKKSNESDKATFKSNPLGVEQGVEWSKLGKKLKNFESSKVTTPEAVSGWLNKTDNQNHGNGDNGNTNEDVKADEKKEADDNVQKAWNFFGNPKGKGKKNKNKKFDFGNWGANKNDNIADDKKDNEEKEAEKKDDKAGDGGGDVWDNTAPAEDWDNDKNDEKKENDKKDAGNGNGGATSSWW